MSDDKLAKVLLATPNKIKKIDNELCLLSEAVYNDDGCMVMSDICPLCNVMHYTPFKYINGGAQIVCPVTGVKIYAIYG